MKRLLITSALALVLSLTGSLAASTQKPNLLFILTEDQGSQLGFLGTPGLQTPQMDALAKSGVFFRNTFVAYPVCSPSKAAIYTSLPNHLNGILNNTPNFHKPAEQLTPAERTTPLYVTNRIAPGIPTLIERLKDAGYYQGVTHKLHVAPNEKFPYDEFIQGDNRAAVAGFLDRAGKSGKPWHLFLNIGQSHRPYPDSDKTKIRVKPDEVKLPAFLPDTPIVRQDWAEYLAAIEAADHLVGEALAALRASGQDQNTIIVCLGGDHGPSFPHGKMTLHDLGLRVTLSISGPGISHGVSSKSVVSTLDLAPTLLDLLGLPPFPKSYGLSLRPVLQGKATSSGREFAPSEISDLGTLPNKGMQERSLCDGRWHLIARSGPAKPWRQVQADSKQFPVWGNRSYDEILRVKDRFPEPYRILAEMDPQSLDGHPPVIELYDLEADPDEMTNLANDPNHRKELERMMKALGQWCNDTQDTSFKLPDLKPTP